MFPSLCASLCTKWNRLWKDECWNKFRYRCIHQNNLIKKLIKKHWRSSGVFIANFEKIPRLFLIFYCWIWLSVVDFIYQQRSKCRQVKATKHASTGTNYAILTKWVKEQHERKPVSNLKSMQKWGGKKNWFWANICKIYWDFISERIMSM